MKREEALAVTVIIAVAIRSALPAAEGACALPAGTTCGVTALSLLSPKLSCMLLTMSSSHFGVLLAVPVALCSATATTLTAMTNNIAFVPLALTLTLTLTAAAIQSMKTRLLLSPHLLQNHRPKSVCMSVCVCVCACRSVHF